MPIHLHFKIKIIYLILLLGLSLDIFSTEQEKYLHFTEVDGLPRNITTCIEQDQYGYLWTGTTNGIAQYDGNSFYSYKELAGVSVFGLLYDSHNTLWAATGKGLYKYNRLTNQFDIIVEGFIPKVQEFENDIYFIMYSGIGKIVGNKFEVFYKASDLADFFISKEGIWLAKSTDGVWLVNRNNKQNILAKYLQGKYVALINKIDDKLFVGCYNGQLYCIPEDGKLVQLEFANHYFPKKFAKVGREIWLATDGNGIIVFDNNLKYIRTLSRSKNTEASVNSNSIYDIYPGKNNEIWLASFGAGLTCILPDNLLFQNILPEKGNENSLVANEGVSVFVKQPLIYFGTNYGLSVWNENTNRFKNLSSEKLRKDLNGNKVTAINVDAYNNLWIGTYDGLLGKYSSDLKLIKTFHPSSSSPNEMQQIVHIAEIDKSNLLILTQFQNNILLHFNIETEKTDVFELNSKGSNITYLLINSLRKNQHGKLLALIADKGLYAVNWKENILENKFQEMNKKLNSYMVDFYQDKKGRYWIASTSGLVCISADGKYFKRYTTKDGLPSNNLSRIEPENDQYLWISSISGICRLNTQTDEVLNFNLNDGLPANEFYDRVSAKTNDGRIIFGSLAGFTIIDPSKVNSGSSKADMIISDIVFQNQSIRNIEGIQLLKKPLEETKEIWLPYNKNSFSIHFFKKDKNFLKYHNYAYRLKGLEKNWTYLTKTNFANFTNLSPGQYTFEVKSADKAKDGATTSIVIHIRAPWYLSWYAFLV
ncbi:MAG TPA: two-component regulator propeller domain-containing protein, partial [Bacteroidales bacterium]